MGAEAEKELAEEDGTGVAETDQRRLLRASLAAC